MSPQGLFPDDPVPLHHFSSEVFYSSPQQLVQQVAYTLSDKIFTYSPETFELDQAVKRWRDEQSPNAFGFVPGVHSMETRLGAGAATLGYVFSPDFDVSKRHVPQSIIASSGSLLYLRDAFSQLSLLHALTNPVAAHINTACYSGGVLASDYVTAMQISDELGFGLVSSVSHWEMQSMALYATLLAKLSQPTLNVYDGLTSRDTVSVHSPFSNTTLQEAYEWVLEIASGNVMKHTDNEGKALIALNLLNSCLETSYKAFEYCGRRDATHVLVAFGTTEAELSGQIVRVLSDRGLKVGVVHVRLYRPFISEEFSAAVPQSCRNILVLGQVDDQLSVEEVETHSLLYQDVIASMDFNLPNHSLQIRDGKYSRQTVWDLTSLWDRVVTFLGFQLSFEEPGWPSRQVQLSTWALDGSPAADVSSSLVQKAAGLPASRVHVHIGHDNLTQGGITKCDITIHGTVATGNSPAKATLAFVESAKILEHFDVLKSVKPGGAILVALAGVKDDDLDRKFPENFRQALDGKNVHLWILDITASPLAANDQSLEAALAHFAASSVLKKYGVSLDDRLSEVFTKLKAEDIDSLQSEVDQCLREVPPPESAEADDDASGKQVLGPRLKCNSFVPFDQADDESVGRLEDWTAAAKGIVFKEAYDAKRSLRPDAGVATSVVHVKEHRRLTPMYYDRNVFHIEFDLGSSGLTYAIGEALGIHAENDPQDVQQFIQWYGLEANKVVQVPNRESPDIFESRTIYQALAQNVDMFGKPPKRFYEALAEFATDENDRKKLLTISLPEGTVDFKKRAEVDNITYADILQEFPLCPPGLCRSCAHRWTAEATRILHRLRPARHAHLGCAAHRDGRVARPGRPRALRPRDAVPEPPPGRRPRHRLGEAVGHEAAGPVDGAHHHGGAGHGAGAVPRLRAGARVPEDGAGPAHRQRAAVPGLAAPARGVPVRRGVGGVPGGGRGDVGRKGLLARPAAQDLHPGPHAADHGRDPPGVLPRGGELLPVRADVAGAGRDGGAAGGRGAGAEGAGGEEGGWPARD